MKMKRMLTGFLALLLAVCRAPGLSARAEAAGDGTQTCRALLVGCDQFLSQDETTPIAHNNIQMMETVLSQDTRGFSVSRLDGLANGAASLKAAIEWAFSGADEDDISLLYISTHGLFESNRTLPEGALPFSDGSLEEEVGAQALEAMLDSIPGEKVILVDACASGALIGKGVSPSVGSARVRAAFRREDYHVLVSAGANELSWYWQADTQEAPPGASYFTAALVAGAGLYGTYGADANADGVITLREMYAYLRTGQPSSSAQAYPQEDDFPLICYDPDKATDSTLGELTGIVFQRTALNQHVRHDRPCDQQQHINIEIARNEQRRKLRDIADHVYSCTDVAGQILPLIGQQNGFFVGKKEIADDRIEQIQQIQRVQVDRFRIRSMDQPREERRHAQAGGQNHRSDDRVYFAYKRQVTANLFPVALRHGLIHAIDDCGIKPKLRKAQHLEDRGKQAGKARIFRAHNPEDHRPVQKRKNDGNDSVDDSRRDVPRRVSGSAVRHFVCSFAKAYFGECARSNLSQINAFQLPNDVPHIPLVHAFVVAYLAARLRRNLRGPLRGAGRQRNLDKIV